MPFYPFPDSRASKRAMAKTCALFLLLALLSPLALAGDTWTAPFAGIRLLKRTTSAPRTLEIFALEVDLSNPRIVLRSTAYGERKQTPGEFAKTVNAHAAINADFYNMQTFIPRGMAAGNGALWPNSADNASRAVFAFGPGRAEIYPQADITVFDPGWMTGAISGFPDIVRDGRAVSPHASASKNSHALHPRTAIGLSRDKKTLWLVVVDGRSAVSGGVTCEELGVLMKDLGAHSAINLDGGGSSALVVKTGKSYPAINTPSGGKQRTVANHLAVIVLDAPPETRKD